MSVPRVSVSHDAEQDWLSVIEFGRVDDGQAGEKWSALSDDSEMALALWLRCLEAGDSTAHYGVGYTLYELGRYREAYRHLRHYAEVAPEGPWTWYWLGKAATAIGELDEAREAFEVAIALDEDEETDAAQLLIRVSSPQPPSQS